MIEDKASGTQLIQELIADGCHGVVRYQPMMDKIMRLHAQTAMIENGFVYIPECAPWLAEYLHEMTVFPNGKHDDQVNSTAQFLDWLQTPMPSAGMYELTRRQAVKLKPPEPVFVRVKASPGIGSVQTFSGLRITIGEDRIVEMTAEDADCLIPAGWTKRRCLLRIPAPVVEFGRAGVAVSGGLLHVFERRAAFERRRDEGDAHRVRRR